MKITIDTNTDSKEDIQKVMQILSHFTNSSTSTAYVSNEEKKSEPVDTTSMMNMFGTPTTENNEPVTKELPERDPGTPPDFSSFLNLTNNEQEKKDDEQPKVEFF